MQRIGGAAVLVLLAVACSGDDGSVVEGVEVADGFAVVEVRAGLRGPTQIDLLPDGRLLVAQLNGGEADGTGQVVAVDLDSDEPPDVLYEGLQKPTGVAVLDDDIWVMEERRLSRGPMAGGQLDVVLDDLAYNGRSQGTLTADPDGRILYDTSGTVDGTDAATGSAGLWALTPGGEPSLVATGFKHAYARTFAADGTLWQTEMSDGTYDGEAAPDELVVVQSGDDFGWPQCVGDGRPVAFYGGTAERCAPTPPSHTLFAPGATPTSVAVAPWDPDTLLVALWNEGRVVAVPATGEQPVEVTTFLDGIERPQHLLVDGDRVLLSDFGGGRIVAIERTEE